MRWGEFAMEQMELAEAGRGLLYQFGGVGLAFLATTRADGAPRVHPMCPLLTPTDLFAFIVPSPKRQDLRRDGRYAMHSYPTDNDEDAFYVTGHARSVDDQAVRIACAEQFAAERAMARAPEELPTWELFAFDISSCLLTRTTGHGDPKPQHAVWLAEHPRRNHG